MEEGASLCARDREGRCALHWACKTDGVDREEVVEWILESADGKRTVNWLDSDGVSMP